MQKIKLSDYTYAEYYEHKRIEFKVAGIKVSVVKPYREIPNYRGRCSTNGVVCVSQNCTSMVLVGYLKELEECARTAVRILNHENDGFDINMGNDIGKDDCNIIYTDQIPANIRSALARIDSSTGEQKTKSIPYKEVRKTHIYEDIKGNKYIYLGNCLVEEHDVKSKGYFNINDKPSDTLNPVHGGGPRPNDYVTECYLDLETLQPNIIGAMQVQGGSQLDIRCELSYYQKPLLIRSSRIKFVKDLGTFIQDPISIITKKGDSGNVEKVYVLHFVEGRVSPWRY